MVTPRKAQILRTLPLMLIVALFCRFACGKVIYVDDDGQADFGSIQAGIDAAQYGDTVSVAPGTYYENITLKDGVDLSGAGAEVTIIDAQGYPVNVYFQRPDEIDIYIDITLIKDADYPADGDETIRQNIINHAAGLLLSETGFAGFGIGEDILLSRLYTPINRVQGHSVSVLEIGLSFGTVAPSNLVLAFDEIGDFDITQIKINGVTG